MGWSTKLGIPIVPAPCLPTPPENPTPPPRNSWNRFCAALKRRHATTTGRFRGGCSAPRGASCYYLGAIRGGCSALPDGSCNRLEKIRGGCRVPQDASCYRYCITRGSSSAPHDAVALGSRCGCCHVQRIRGGCCVGVLRGPSGTGERRMGVPNRQGTPAWHLLLLLSSRTGLAVPPAPEWGYPLLYHPSSAYCLGMCGKILCVLYLPRGPGK